MKRGKIALALCALIFVGVFSALPSTLAFTPPAGWSSYDEVTLTDTGLANHVDEPVDILFSPDAGTCQSVDEIRVIAPDGVTEIPSQVYDVVTSGGFITSCRVVFLANVPALSSVKYYIVYNNPYATAPVYDGLRLYSDVPNDAYNVTALVGGVEKNYVYTAFYSFEFYVNGTELGQGTNFFGVFGHMSPSTLWADAWGGLWFGSGKDLKVVNSGPVFVEFNYSEPYAVGWLGGFDSNLTYTCLLRVYFQPNLLPLTRYESTFTINTNLPWFSVGGPVYMDFRLGNSTVTAAKALYRNITYSWGAWGTFTDPVETVLTWTTVYYQPWGMLGWWSYNGSRPDSAVKPEANIGLIPVAAGGTCTETTNPGYNIAFYQEIDAAAGDHHNGQWMLGVYNGTTGDTAGTTGYIVIYNAVDGNIQPFMDNKAAALRTPLTISVTSFHLIRGDVNVDWCVNILDVVRAGLAFGSVPSDPNWDPYADLNQDAIINIIDLVIIGVNFGANCT